MSRPGDEDDDLPADRMRRPVPCVYARLGQAVLAQAWLDAALVRWHPTSSARRWLASEASRFWCEVADIDHEALVDAVRRQG